MAPFRQRTVYEVHSDMSFYELNGGEPMQWLEAHRERDRRTPRALLEPSFRVSHASSRRSCQEHRWPTSSTSQHSSGRRAGYSPGRPSESLRIPNGTSRDLRMEIVR